MTDAYKKSRDEAADKHAANNNVSWARREWENSKSDFIIGADWGYNFALNGVEVNRLVEAARVVIAENDQAKGWDDLHDAWYAFKAVNK